MHPISTSIPSSSQAEQALSETIVMHDHNYTSQEIFTYSGFTSTIVKLIASYPRTLSFTEQRRSHLLSLLNTGSLEFTQLYQTKVELVGLGTRCRTIRDAMHKYRKHILSSRRITKKFDKGALIHVKKIISKCILSPPNHGPLPREAQFCFDSMKNCTLPTKYIRDAHKILTVHISQEKSNELKRSMRNRLSKLGETKQSYLSSHLKSKTIPISNLVLIHELETGYLDINQIQEAINAAKRICTSEEVFLLLKNYLQKQITDSICQDHGLQLYHNLPQPFKTDPYILAIILPDVCTSIEQLLLGEIDINKLHDILKTVGPFMTFKQLQTASSLYPTILLVQDTHHKQSYELHQQNTSTQAIDNSLHNIENGTISPSLLVATIRSLLSTIPPETLFQLLLMYEIQHQYSEEHAIEALSQAKQLVLEQQEYIDNQPGTSKQTSTDSQWYYRPYHKTNMSSYEGHQH